MSAFFKNTIICRINTIADGTFKRLYEVRMRSNRGVAAFLTQVALAPQRIHRVRIRYHRLEERVALIEIQTKPHTLLRDFLLDWQADNMPRLASTYDVLTPFILSEDMENSRKMYRDLLSNDPLIPLGLEA